MFEKLKALFEAFIYTVQVRHGVFPTAATGFAAAAVTLTAAAAWTFGAYVQIVAAVGVTKATLITGFTLENFTGVPSQGEVIIAIGPGGVEVEIGRYQVTTERVQLFNPLYIQNATRISAAYRTSTGAADTVDIKLNTATLS